MNTMDEYHADKIRNNEPHYARRVGYTDEEEWRIDAANYAEHLKVEMAQIKIIPKK